MPVSSSVVGLVRPLARKLPLLIAALLTVVLASFGWFVDRELRAAFERVAGDRLTVAAQRVASMLSESTGPARTEMRRLAADSAVVMPQQNGRAVATQLRELRPGLRILFMSGYTDDDVIRRGIVQSQSEFLQKPFTPDELTRRIREVLDRRELRKLA